MSYQNVNTAKINTLTAIESNIDKQSAPAPTAYFKISKEQLFGGLLPQTLFESSSLIDGSPSMQQTNPSSQFGTNYF